MFLLLLAVGAAIAQPDVTAGANVSTTLRLGTADCGPLSSSGATCGWLNFHDGAVFAPWVEAAPSSKVRARGAVDVRLDGPTALGGDNQLDRAGEIEVVQPVSLRVRDAWIATHGRWVDLRLGAQRVAWGVATGISLVDNVDPWDLEDPTRFDRRLSVVSGVATLHGGAFQCQAVAVPWFVPAVLPVSGVKLMAGADDLFDASDFGAQPGSIDVGQLDTRVTMPPQGPSGGSVAGRLGWSGPVDLALSWFHGRDSLPQVAGDVVLTGFQTDSHRVDVGIPIVYPKLDVGGIEARGTLGSFTAWGEAALVLPERTVAAPSAAQLEALQHLGTISSVPDPIPQTVTQDGRPFARWIAGVDRFFGPVYANVQWLHGFPTERQAADLHDYGLLALRWTLVPSVRVQARGASDARGWLADGEVDVLYADAAQLLLGGTWVGGPDGDALAGFRGVSGIRAGAKVSF